MRNIILMCALATAFFVGGMLIGWNSAERASKALRETHSMQRSYGGALVQVPFAETASPSLAAQLRTANARLEEYRQRCYAWSQYVWRLEHSYAEQRESENEGQR